jgi:hypothetical protein
LSVHNIHVATEAQARAAEVEIAHDPALRALCKQLSQQLFEPNGVPRRDLDWQDTQTLFGYNIGVREHGRVFIPNLFTSALNSNPQIMASVRAIGDRVLQSLKSTHRFGHLLYIPEDQGIGLLLRSPRCTVQLEHFDHVGEHSGDPSNLTLSVLVPLSLQSTTTFYCGHEWVNSTLKVLHPFDMTGLAEYKPVVDAGDFVVFSAGRTPHAGTQPMSLEDPPLLVVATLFLTVVVRGYEGGDTRTDNTNLNPSLAFMRSLRVPSRHLCSSCACHVMAGDSGAQVCKSCPRMHSWEPSLVCASCSGSNVFNISVGMAEAATMIHSGIQRCVHPTTHFRKASAFERALCLLGADEVNTAAYFWVDFYTHVKELSLSFHTVEGILSVEGSPREGESQNVWKRFALVFGAVSCPRARCLLIVLSELMCVPYVVPRRNHGNDRAVFSRRNDGEVRTSRLKCIQDLLADQHLFWRVIERISNRWQVRRREENPARNDFNLRCECRGEVTLNMLSKRTCDNCFGSQLRQQYKC